MKELASLSKRRSLLNSLQSISLAVSSTKITDDWLRELNLALSDSPLTHFHLYSVGGSISAIPLTENAESDFIHSFMLQHGRLLERFAVLRTPFRSQSLQAVAQMGSALKQLFVSMWKKDLVRTQLMLSARLSHIRRSLCWALSSRRLVPSVTCMSHTHTTPSAVHQKSTTTA